MTDKTLMPVIETFQVNTYVIDDLIRDVVNAFPLVLSKTVRGIDVDFHYDYSNAVISISIPTLERNRVIGRIDRNGQFTWIETQNVVFVGHKPYGYKYRNTIINAIESLVEKEE